MKSLGLRVLIGLGAWVLLSSSSTAADRRVAERTVLPIDESMVVERPPPRLDDAVRAEALDERRELRKRMRQRWRDAKPKEREEMREQREQWRRELREELSDDERQQLRHRMREREVRRAEVRDLSPAERRRLAEQMEIGGGEERRALRRRLRDVPPAEREALRENLRTFRRLAAQDQQVLRENLDALQELPGPARENLDANRRRWESMSASEQDALRRRMRRLREMTPDRREQLLDRLAPSKNRSSRKGELSGRVDESQTPAGDAP